MSLGIDASHVRTPAKSIGVMNRPKAEDVPLDLVEQPVPARDVDGMVRVRAAIKTPALAGESVFSPRQRVDVLQKRPRIMSIAS